MAGKGKETTLNEVLEAVNRGFTEVEKRFSKIDKRFTENDFRIDNIEKAILGSRVELSNLKFELAETKQNIRDIKEDTIFLKDVAEKHSKILKDLDEERLFTLNYVKRLDNEAEKMKAHLKIA